MKRREAIATLLVGIAMGLVDAVPGISGGTIAFIAGRYQRLTSAIAAVDTNFIRALLNGDTDVLRQADTFFLVVLFGGLGVGGLTMARLVEVALRVAPAAVNGFFFGIIAGSAVVIGGELDKSLQTGLTLLVGTGVAAALGGLSLGGLSSSLTVVFFAGTLATAALLLPGVSGSFVLYLLGQYELVVTETVAQLPEHTIALVTGNGSLEPFAVLGAFGLGGLLGAGTIARAATLLLKRHREPTLGLLTGLMVGSLRVPAARVAQADSGLGLAVGAAIVGLAGAAILGYLGR